MNNEDMTNEQRARRVLVAIKTYHDYSGIDIDDPVGTVDSCAIDDLLCDLHHLSDLLGCEWETRTMMGEVHYDAEVNGED